MSTPLVVRVVGWSWFFAALLAGHFLLLQTIPPPAVQALLVALTALLLAAYLRVAPFRRWVDALDLRLLVALHLTRFVGLYFIHLYNRGELPYAFAVPAGAGDIAVATLALGVLALPPTAAFRRSALIIWNMVGLTDILFVVVSAARFGLADPESMRALTRLPLSLLPTFLVPLIIVTHLVIFIRLARKSGA